MKKFSKAIGGIFAVSLVFFTTTYYIDYPSYSYEQTTLPSSFDEFYQAKLNTSQKIPTRPGNEEKLIRYSKGKTPIAILYIHGFGASRAEGELVTDRIANQFQANTYYLRLPGHGTSPEDHRDTGFQNYLKTAEDSLLMMDRLGDKTLVIGTSMGGLLTTYLAAKYPDKIAGIILVSPYYDFTDKSGNIYNFVWGKKFVNLVFGEIRKNTNRNPNDPSFAYWYKDQYYAAIQNLNDLKRTVANSETYEKVTVPVLMFYYYKSETEQDGSADVSKMLEAFQQFGRSAQPHPLNKKVAVENGAHVLFSQWIPSDKELVYKESVDFIQALLTQP